MTNRTSNHITPSIRKIVFFVAFAVLFFNVFIVSANAADMSVPALVNYQGTLTDAGGNALADGSYDIEFRIWSKSSAFAPGDELIWGIKYSNIQLVKGQFNVILGAGGGEAVKDFQNPAQEPKVNDIGFAFTQPERYLGIKIVKKPLGAVTSPTEISPRQQILSAPYAVQAERASHHQNIVPIGMIISYWGTTAPPEGWLFCNGQSINKSTLPEASDLIDHLNRVAGNALGSSATLPDLRGVFLRGLNSFGTLNEVPVTIDPEDRLIPDIKPRKLGCYQQDQFESHFTRHNHTYYLRIGSGGSGSGQNSFYKKNETLNTSTVDAPPTTGRFGSETRPVNIGITYIIKY